MQIEANVKQPAAERHHPDSIPNQILALDVDQSWSRADRLGSTSTWDDICDSKSRMKNTLTKAVSRAKEGAPERTFVTSQGDFRAADGCVIVSYVVTRTA